MGVNIVGYTRTQLKQAMQAKSNLEKKFESKLELAAGAIMILTIALGMGAVTGALAV